MPCSSLSQDFVEACPVAVSKRRTEFENSQAISESRAYPALIHSSKGICLELYRKLSNAREDSTWERERLRIRSLNVLLQALYKMYSGWLMYAPGSSLGLLTFFLSRVNCGHRLSAGGDRERDSAGSGLPDPG